MINNPHIKIGTHSGPFHLDDAVAVATLDLHFGKSGIEGFELVRTREDVKLSECDIRVDVGGEYNHEAHTYDHHQKGGAGKRVNGVPYASAGLVWKHFGRGLVETDEAHSIVDERLIQFVDAIDSGIKKHGSETYSLYEVVRGFNIKAEENGNDYDAVFKEVEGICKQIVKNEIVVANRQVIDNVTIRDLLNKFDSKPYVVLEKELAWQPTLVGETDKKYVIFPGDSSVRVRCIPTVIDGFESRQRLPKLWGGLPSPDLEKISGISGAIFCHPGGFIAGTKTIEAAIGFAEKANEIYLSGLGAQN